MRSQYRVKSKKLEEVYKEVKKRSEKSWEEILKLRNEIFGEDSNKVGIQAHEGKGISQFRIDPEVFNAFGLKLPEHFFYPKSGRNVEPGYTIKPNLKSKEGKAWRKRMDETINYALCAEALADEMNLPTVLGPSEGPFRSTVYHPLIWKFKDGNFYASVGRLNKETHVFEGNKNWKDDDTFESITELTTTEWENLVEKEEAK